MKNAFLFTGLLISLALRPAYGMDNVPTEILEHGIATQLDQKSLENLANTSKANNEKMKNVWKNLGVKKQAKFSCPSGKEAVEALGMDGSSPTHITINGVVWEVSKTGHNLVNTREILAEDKLNVVFIFSKPSEAQSGEFLESVMCGYAGADKTNSNAVFFIGRKLAPSMSHIIGETCKPFDLSYQAQVTLALPTNAGLPYTLKPASPDGPFPDGLEIICDQEKN